MGRRTRLRTGSPALTAKNNCTCEASAQIRRLAHHPHGIPHLPFPLILEITADLSQDSSRRKKKPNLILGTSLSKLLSAPGSGKTDYLTDSFQNMPLPDREVGGALDFFSFTGYNFFLCGGYEVAMTDLKEPSVRSLKAATVHRGAV
jgi:hypothetical protein